MGLQDYINNIIYLCHFRYESCNKDFINVVEGIDEELNTQIDKMFKQYCVNRDSFETFYRMFKELLNTNTEWQLCIQDFGKDFDFTEEFLFEKMENINLCQD